MFSKVPYVSAWWPGTYLERLVGSDWKIYMVTSQNLMDLDKNCGKGFENVGFSRNISCLVVDRSRLVGKWYD